METFAPARYLVDDPDFAAARQRILSRLRTEEIDDPLRDTVARLNARPYAITLQCCWGHFVHAGQPEPESLDRLPDRDPGEIEYRIAYLALAVANTSEGAAFRDELAGLTRLAPDLAQFGSPGWFWDQRPNSYALQVEPERFADRDRAVIGYDEALRVEAARDEVFAALARLVRETGETP